MPACRSNWMAELQVGEVFGSPDPSAHAAVVTATYNEAGNLPALLGELLSLNPPVCCVVVDDSSPDGTGELAKQAARENPGRVVAIVRPGKLGYASAVRRGLWEAYRAGVPRLATMDADLSHEPSVLPALIRALDGADLAIGSRYVQGGGTDESWPWYRRLLSRSAGAYVRLATGAPIMDPTSGFRAFRRELLRRIAAFCTVSEGYSFLLETAVKAWVVGARIAEVPITFRERQRGRSKISRRIIAEAFCVATSLGLACRLPWLRRRLVEELSKWAEQIPE